jgi:hypothetical protein
MDLPLGEKDETRIAENTAALEPSQADATEAAEKEKEGVTHGV